MATKTRKDPASEGSKELFLTIQQAQRNAIRAKLLQCLEGEQISHVRNKVGDAIAELARQYTEEGTISHQGTYARIPANDSSPTRRTVA